MPDDQAIRASDAEREAVVIRLRDACAAGRLTIDELAERVDRAYAARTRAELQQLVRDLPGATLPSRPARRLPALGREHSLPDRFVVESERSQVASRALARLAPLLVARGYALDRHDDRALVFTRDVRPAWTILVAVLVFPLGLLALLYRRRSTATVAFVDVEGGTEVTVDGDAPLGIRRALALLRDEPGS